MPALLSAQDPAAIVKERQATMKKISDHMKAINEFVEAGNGSAEDVSTRAAEIAQLSEKIPSLFPSGTRSEEHTSELQSLMRISYAVFCLKKKKTNKL